MPERIETVKVWDPVVRIGHWVLVAAFFTAYFTEEELLAQHVWAGYAVAGVVLLRILWGFIGSEHARFSDFLYSPVQALRYLGRLATHRARRYIGHSPAGAVMIFALLASLAVTTFSGLEIYAIEENAGPLAVVAATGPPSLINAARADGRGDEDSDAGAAGNSEAAEEFWEDIHEASANFTVFLVLLHVAGVLAASFSHRENLVKSMVTGRKRGKNG
ncbi:MAG TPA: cytochrome b/b6 domain-containing protein [Woeseiaceae bacterium]|nr:cytochrome b/b6 domain-containing protein [Woeseiaceae bacterium]